MLVELEHILNVGIDSIIVTLSCALFHIATLFDEVAPTDLMRNLTRVWSVLDILVCTI
jgi:hypothetical protein